MRNLKLSQSYSMIALNAQDSIHMTTIKKVSLHCIAAAVVLESYLNGDFTEINEKLLLKKSYIENPNITLYQEAVFKPLFNKKEVICEDLKWWLSKASNLGNKYLKKLEVTMADFLKGYNHMEEIPSLLGCDIYYKTAGLLLREYRSDIGEYCKIIEFLRAEVLEDGTLSDENMLMLWLLRESGYMQDIFSKGDLEIVDKRMHKLIINNKMIKKLYDVHIYHGVEMAVKGFLNLKKNAMKTPTGIGINFVFPIIERSQSIFIDTEEWLPKASQRLEDVKKRLQENGHNYIIIREGAVPLIKIDNIIYEAIPEAIQGRIPIHGVRLRRYPI